MRGPRGGDGKKGEAGQGPTHFHFQKTKEDRKEVKDEEETKEVGEIPMGAIDDEEGKTEGEVFKVEKCEGEGEGKDGEAGQGPTHFHFQNSKEDCKEVKYEEKTKEVGEILRSAEVEVETMAENYCDHDLVTVLLPSGRDSQPTLCHSFSCSLTTSINCGPP